MKKELKIIGQGLTATTLLIMFLVSCAYNGLSGSSGRSCPAELTGLWIQAESAPITEGSNQEDRCGCRELGASTGALRRCFQYFSGGFFVAGYLSNPDKANGNCAAEVSLTTGEKEAILADLTAITSAGVTNAGPPVSAASGECEVKGTGSTSKGSGVYFDLRYPAANSDIAGREIICTSYLLREGDLYIAADPSGGGIPQNQNPALCNSARFTGLIKYTKVE